MASHAVPALPTAKDEEVHRLREDLQSAHIRNRALIKALTRAAVAPTVVGVLRGADPEHDHTVFLSNGVKLERRRDTEHGWRYVQAECIPTTVAAVVDAAVAGTPRGTVEMAVVLE